MQVPNEPGKAERRGENSPQLHIRLEGRELAFPPWTQLRPPATECMLPFPRLRGTHNHRDLRGQSQLDRSLRISYLEAQKMSDKVIKGNIVERSLANFLSECNWFPRQSDAGDVQNTPVNTQLLVQLQQLAGHLSFGETTA